MALAPELMCLGGQNKESHFWRYASILNYITPRQVCMSAMTFNYAFSRLGSAHRCLGV